MDQYKQNEDDEILECKDLVPYGLKPNTTYSLVRQKRIPHIRLGPRFVRFSKNAILEWLRSHEVSAVGEEK